MQQLPVFLNLSGQPVIVLGSGDAADAKRRLIERAGGLCVGIDHLDARLAVVAMEDIEQATAVAAQLKKRGLLVNVVDRPELCDFTTPAILDRDPVLIAVGTGGASAGMAKAIRQRLEQLLPENVGALAKALQTCKAQLRMILPDPADRRRALDNAMVSGGPLDPFTDHDDRAVIQWIASPISMGVTRLEVVTLTSGDPDQLTLYTARLLGSADWIYHDVAVPVALLSRARADAVRVIGAPPKTLNTGLSVHLQLSLSETV